MDDIDELVRKEMERFYGNSTVTAGRTEVPPRPSAPPAQPFQPSPKTKTKQPERDPEVSTPVHSTSQTCAKPTVEIVEQPAHFRRFRYDSEIESAGQIKGVQGTKNQKSFPKIRIGNYEGPAEITVSLVCKDEPYRVHPNGIVSNNSTEKKSYIYVKKVRVTRDDCVFQFDDLRIRIVKLSQIEDALRLRETQKVDPFGQGFKHKFDPKTDDLQAVRLCFEVKLKLGHKLDPVVSDIIKYSKKLLSCLQITEVIQSGSKVILFSQPGQLNPKDVEVVFYNKENMWKRFVKKFDISDTSGIVCAVPTYPHAIECDTEVTVFLRRLSDRICGDPRPFTYYADTDATYKKKRKMVEQLIKNHVENNWTPPASLAPDNESQYDQDWQKMPGPFDDNPTMPGPSFVNPAVPGPNSVNTGVSGLNHVNSAVPGPSFINSAVSGSNHNHSAVARPNSVNPALPGPSFINSAVSVSNHDHSAVARPSSVNPAVTGPSSVTAGVLGPNYVRSTVLEPAFVNLAVPVLNGDDPFLPEPIEASSMQINAYMSPDKDKDKDIYSSDMVRTSWLGIICSRHIRR